jgi:hypothetical protein
VTYMGYEVEPVAEPAVRVPKVHYIGYFLRGKRGAFYALMRYPLQPHLMYVVNSKGNVCGVKGNYTFTDEGGALRARS